MVGDPSNADQQEASSCGQAGLEAVEQPPGRRLLRRVALVASGFGRVDIVRIGQRASRCVASSPCVVCGRRRPGRAPRLRPPSADTPRSCWRSSSQHERAFAGQAGGQAHSAWRPNGRRLRPGAPPRHIFDIIVNTNQGSKGHCGGKESPRGDSGRSSSTAPTAHDPTACQRFPRPPSRDQRTPAPLHALSAAAGQDVAAAATAAGVDSSGCQGEGQSGPVTRTG